MFIPYTVFHDAVVIFAVGLPNAYKLQTLMNFLFYDYVTNNMWPTANINTIILFCSAPDPTRGDVAKRSEYRPAASWI